MHSKYSRAQRLSIINVLNKTAHPVKKPGFSFEKFKEMDKDNSRLDNLYLYAYDHLRSLGEGAGRAAFLLNNKKVLKVAKNESGIVQNETEVSVYNDPTNNRELIAAIYEYDPNYKWIVTELVKPYFSYEGAQEDSAHKDVPKFLKSDELKELVDRNDLYAKDVAEKSVGKSMEGKPKLFDYGVDNYTHKTYYNHIPDE